MNIVLVTCQKCNCKCRKMSPFAPRAILLATACAALSTSILESKVLAPTGADATHLSRMDSFVHAAEVRAADAADAASSSSASALQLEQDGASAVDSARDALQGAHALDALWSTVMARQQEGDDGTSYTAKLLKDWREGGTKAAQKVGEEATEVVIEAVLNKKEDKKEKVISESADLLYHLHVLWAASGVEPAEVYAELSRRENKSGLEEKASRVKK